jgi:hypothetical protein
MATYDEVRKAVGGCIKRIEANDRCHVELRESLNCAVKKRLIGSLPDLNLSKTADRVILMEIANSFLDSGLVTRATIKERNWSDGMINKFLGSPDVLVRNPRYKSAAPMQLFSLNKVILLEGAAEVASAMESISRNRESRQAGAVKATETKTQRLMSFVESLEIKIPVMPVPRLMEEAVQHYNYHWESRSMNRWDGGYSDKNASINDSPDFLERIMGNYVRHELTTYESQLEEIAGKTGVGDAYELLRGNIMSAFYRAYPDLLSRIISAQADWLSYEQEEKLARAAERQKRDEAYISNPKSLFDDCKKAVRRRKKLNGINTTTGALSKAAKNNRKQLINDINALLSMIDAPKLTDQSIGDADRFASNVLLELESIGNDYHQRPLEAMA